MWDKACLAALWAKVKDYVSGLGMFKYFSNGLGEQSELVRYSYHFVWNARRRADVDLTVVKRNHL